MKITVFAVDENDSTAKQLSLQLGGEYSLVEIHRFPDRESCIRIVPEHVTETCFVVATLFQPDTTTLPLLFLSDTLRDYGARKVILIAPYLAYMRQDKRFNEGEGITAKYYAHLISGYFDTLVTVDPHLHRINNLHDIYSIPAHVIHAVPAVSDWIKNKINEPVLIGPDSESEQWVKELARLTEAPYIVLEKIRHGDRHVEISVPEVEKWKHHTPVLFDDIISTGKTMIETIKHLHDAGMAAPVCIGVHGVFSEDAWQELLAAGPSKIITTNTIPHPSNGIDLSGLIVERVQEMVLKE